MTSITNRYIDLIKYSKSLLTNICKEKIIHTIKIVKEFN